MCYRFDLITNESKKVDLVYNFHLLLQNNLKINLLNEAYYICLDETPQIKKASFGLKLSDKIIYNARHETILDKDIFKTDYIIHKAVFPCNAFYEKDKNKVERRFISKDNVINYLAGFIINDSFIILTRNAPEEFDSFKRLPIYLSEEDVDLYLKSDQDISILNKFNKKIFHLEGYYEPIKLL